MNMNITQLFWSTQVFTKIKYQFTWMLFDKVMAGACGPVAMTSLTEYNPAPTGISSLPIVELYAGANADQVPVHVDAL
ncbi:uncharacterized protein N7479_010565 [Penicillium vulpinum]|uniref:uncharacterized protein n=1 Tax=Penicillium vulpinum TaxID=29845 RepID=UPI002549698E|nr:uncharacterized protein N7479_010565 [Penicillium vulpinum]KAJ5952152.1 hypothetical protein N7479_010565 [Penicillium vulpinum]